MRRFLVPIVVASLALGAWLGGSILIGLTPQAPTALAQSGYSGRLILGRLDGLWQLPLDGTAPMLVLPMGDRDFVNGVTWSPGGTQVAYMRMSYDPQVGTVGSDLHLVGLDGTDRLLLPRDEPNALMGFPSWSPDGTRIYYDYSRYESGGTVVRRIERIGLDGKNRVIEVDGGLAPSLSADGSVMVYLQVEAEGVTIRARRLTTGLDTPVLPAGILTGVYLPSVSPDGTSVAFAANGTPLSQETPIDCSPIVSPDGAWFAPLQAQAHGLPTEIWRVNLDGSGLTRLTVNCLDDPIIAWSSDGSWLAAYGGTNLILLRPDGTSLIPVWYEGSYSGIDWAP